MKLAETVTFGGSGLDRAAQLRGDAKAIEAEGAAVILPVWRGKPLFAGPDRSLGLIPPTHSLLKAHGGVGVFLGLSDGQPVCAVDVSGWEPDDIPASIDAFLDPSEQTHPDLPVTHSFAELRSVMWAVSPRNAELAATAKAVLGWHRTHEFCALCGEKSVVAQAGWQRDCPGCGGHHFPRTDPVVIMLITYGNQVLVGRSPGWPDGMYSLLAGFVEPGETIEAAVRRETFEESGIRVGAVEYLSSQPWPFPSSLMLGCRGDAKNTDITLDPVELEDARWVSREEMLQIMAGRHPEIKAARKGAIAHFLLSHWLRDTLN